MFIKTIENYGFYNTNSIYHLPNTLCTMLIVWCTVFKGQDTLHGDDDGYLDGLDHPWPLLTCKVIIVWLYGINRVGNLCYRFVVTSLQIRTYTLNSFKLHKSRIYPEWEMLFWVKSHYLELKLRHGKGAFIWITTFNALDVRLFKLTVYSININYILLVKMHRSSIILLDSDSWWWWFGFNDALPPVQ